MRIDEAARKFREAQGEQAEEILRILVLGRGGAPMRRLRDRSAWRADASLDPELRLEDLVDRLRVGLAAGRLHDLADEPAEQASASPWPARPCRGWRR